MAQSRTETSPIAPGESRTTTDHETIRKWVEARGGWPARVKATGDTCDPGVLRIDFPGYSGQETLERIDWNTFFCKFEEAGLALAYQERTKDGELSNFNKLISRENA